MAGDQKKAEKKRLKRRKALLRHKQVVALEGLLVIRWLLRYAEMMIKDQDWSPWLQISAIMILIAGTFGWFLYFIQQATEKSVDTTKRIVDKMPLPIPMLIIHLCIFAILFIAYAWQLGFVDEIFADAEQGVKQLEF